MIRNINQTKEGPQFCHAGTKTDECRPGLFSRRVHSQQICKTQSLPLEHSSAFLDVQEPIFSFAQQRGPHFAGMQVNVLDGLPTLRCLDCVFGDIIP